MPAARLHHSDWLTESERERAAQGRHAAPGVLPETLAPQGLHDERAPGHSGLARALRPRRHCRALARPPSLSRPPLSPPGIKAQCAAPTLPSCPSLPRSPHHALSALTMLCHFFLFIFLFFLPGRLKFKHRIFAKKKCFINKSIALNS